MLPRPSDIVADLKQKIANGPQDQVIAAPDGAKLRVQRAPEPGVLVRVDALETHDSVSIVSWEPVSTRPEGYPADLPFIPGRATTYGRTNGNSNLQWYQPSAEEADCVADELRREGWTETPLPSSSIPGMSIRPFLRGDRQRVLIVGSSVTSLVDTPAR